jgi:hypothetical protein
LGAGLHNELCAAYPGDCVLGLYDETALEPRCDQGPDLAEEQPHSVPLTQAHPGVRVQPHGGAVRKLDGGPAFADQELLCWVDRVTRSHGSTSLGDLAAHFGDHRALHARRRLGLGLGRGRLLLGRAAVEKEQKRGEGAELSGHAGVIARPD